MMKRRNKSHTSSKADPIIILSVLYSSKASRLLNISKENTLNIASLLEPFLLIKETQNLASRLFATCFLMSHDSIRSGDDEVTELTTWQKIDNPLLKFSILDIESGTNNTTLVQSSCQFNDNLLGPVIIHNFEFPNVTCFCCSYFFVADHQRRNRR